MGGDHRRQIIPTATGERPAGEMEEPGVFTLDDTGALHPAGDLVAAREAGPDPLASPTLAGLYAAQGHRAMAEAIFTHFGPQEGGGRGEAEDAIPGGTRRQAESLAGSFAERLQAFREAARRVREAAKR